ncbi:hypothetical protein GIW70_15140 [Pseudomonas syringae]|nr:hypothetical protein [Pseudomonas syringae]MCF5069524.1 hypothetical protein [Pseudomonas syringae]
MSKPYSDKPIFPSEQQGAFDPVPTHPEPNSPVHTTEHPDEEPGFEGRPDEEDVVPGRDKQA